jgi:hypothetical protein
MSRDPDARPGRDRVAAQRRVNRIRAFRDELQQLTADRVVAITPEQRRAIDAHHDGLLRELAAVHDVDASEAAGQLSRGMRVASFLAAVALTAAIASLVSRFWGRVDLPLQATLLCAFPLLSLVGVELAAQRERTLYVSSIFALAATGTYWLAVVELSALLNVPLTPPAIWGGALFAVALSMPYGFRVVWGVGLGALLVAIPATLFQIFGIPWTAVIEFPEFITAAAFVMAVLSPLLVGADRMFPAVARGVGFTVGFFGLLMLASAGRISLLPTSSNATALVYQAVMVIACAVTLFAATRKQWLESVYISAAALTVFVLLRFVDWFWDRFPRYLFFFLLAALAIAWLLALRRLRQRLA